jgi:hypothetical protein
MMVEILQLAGLDAAEAEQAAGTLHDHRTGPRDLSRVLVLDDTALLAAHEPAYQRLTTGNRVASLLCVAVGPRPTGERVLRLPGSLGGTQGSPLLWVSDPAGIDWRAAGAAIALGHPPGKVSGLDQLVELLSVDEVFDRVHQVFLLKVRDRVASPGLLLAGADDEAATFAAALAVASRRLSDPGNGAEGPFPALLPSVTGGATLSPGAAIALHWDEVAESVRAVAETLGKLSGLGGVFRRGDAGVPGHIMDVGAALADLRGTADQLLREASTTGELNSRQRQMLLGAGLRFPPEPAPPSSSGPGGSAELSPVHQSIAEAVRGGDTLAFVARRLTLTERESRHHGSASYLPQVEQRCPAALLARLTDPPQRVPRHADIMQARMELGLDAALNAAQELVDLILTVANREWSPAATSASELARLRIAIDGVQKALKEHADAAGKAGTRVRGARLARLGEGLAPVLGDLVLAVLANEYHQPSAGGQEAFRAAHDRAAGLLAGWARHVQAEGVSSRPPFAAATGYDVLPYTGGDDVGEIMDVLSSRPEQEMWQLCAPDDIRALDAAVRPEAVRFASRLSKGALAGKLAGDQPVWTSSGSYAGLLRFVPLKSGFVSSSWTQISTGADPSSMVEP